MNVPCCSVCWDEASGRRKQEVGTGGWTAFFHVASGAAQSTGNRTWAGVGEMEPAPWAAGPLIVWCDRGRMGSTNLSVGGRTEPARKNAAGNEEPADHSVSAGMHPPTMPKRELRGGDRMGGAGECAVLVAQARWPGIVSIQGGGVGMDYKTMKTGRFS
jgi:hypothetical protein